MQDLPILVPALACTVSPCNVRKSSNPEADARLEANIAACGIRQNLIGVPVSRKKVSIASSRAAAAWDAFSA